MSFELRAGLCGRRLLGVGKVRGASGEIQEVLAPPPANRLENEPLSLLGDRDLFLVLEAELFRQTNCLPPSTLKDLRPLRHGPHFCTGALPERSPVPVGGIIFL